MSGPAQVYLLWDFDWMDGSMGSWELVAVYQNEADATTEAARRNESVRQAFLKQHNREPNKEQGGKSRVKAMELRAS